jgi:hypothetical protein
MKKLGMLLTGIAFLTGTAALAGINPADPGLPTGVTANKNINSAMCVDCHTQNPKNNLGTGSHYVNTLGTAGATNSGGSGVQNSGGAAALVLRDAGQYFKITNWAVGTTPATTGWPSKYRNNAATIVNQAPQLVSVVKTMNNTSVLAIDATVAAGADIICESCHNVVGNVSGGNNLLSTQQEWQNNTESTLCVGCHGFMYTNDGTAATANGSNLNYANARNNDEVAGSGKRGNNEVHWIQNVAYPQNHHVMTGDVINGTTAGAGLLWTDNLIVHYSDTTDNASTKGTYAQRASWLNNLTKSTDATRGLNCTNCHAPAHGQGGSAAASILRNATYSTAPAAGGLARISDRSAGSLQWKRINDLGFCGQCHN